MPSQSRRSLRFLIWLAPIILTALGWLAPEALAADRLVEGLDVVLLVDVSRSMYTTTLNQDLGDDQPDGNDPQRLRWHAVQLVLNLLTAEDRVMIVPFNNQAPARSETILIPGDTLVRNRNTPCFLPIGDRRADYRAWIRGVVERFMDPGDGKTGPNIDNGGTGILHALRETAKFAEVEQATSARPIVAILLTDGREDDNQKIEFPKIDDSRARVFYLKPWSDMSPKPVTPVFTIGLGSAKTLNAKKPDDKKPDPDYLRDIAYATGGNFTGIERNDQIISTFRDLIWQLKSAWIKTDQMDKDGSTEDTMHGITEFGILAYSVPGKTLPDGRPDPRNTDPPQTLPQMTWSGANSPPIPLDDFGGRPNRPNVREGYLYRYFGRKYPDERSPFETYARDRLPLKLSTSWTMQQLPHFLYFAKRTARPLFEVIEPVEAQSLPRHQPLTIRLRLIDNPNFQVEQFLLSVRVTTNPANLEVPEGNLELRPQSGSREFVATLPLESLPQGSGDLDFFTLRLKAEGLPQGDNALSGYRLELPPRTIAVDNTLVLEPVDPVVLTAAEPKQRVRLQTEGRHSGRLAIEPTLSPKGLPRRIPVPLSAIRIQPVDDQAIRLVDGVGALDLVVDLKHKQITPGVDYDDLELRLTTLDGSHKRLIAIPVKLRIGLSELSTNPSEARVQAGQKSVAIFVIAKEGSLPENPRVRITLKPKSGTSPLDPSELWIERVGAGSASPSRSQGLLVPLNQAFQVSFEPRREPARHGRYDYEWSMEAPLWAKSSEGTLTLDYDPARLIVDDPPKPVQMGPGQNRDVAIAVRLKGLDGESCRVRFQATKVGTSVGGFRYHSGPLKGQPMSDIRLDPATAGSGPLVSVGADRRAGETVLNLNLRVGNHAGGPPLGEYSIEGVIASESKGIRESEPLKIIVNVNTLEILTAHVLDKPVQDRSDQIEWRPLIGPYQMPLLPQGDYVLTFRVKTGRDEVLLDPKKLVVLPIDTLKNANGGVIDEVPSWLNTTKVIEGDPKELGQLEVSIKFPGVGNPSLRTPYFFNAEIRYDELKLRRVMEFKVIYTSASIGPGG